MNSSPPYPYPDETGIEADRISSQYLTTNNNGHNGDYYGQTRKRVLYVIGVIFALVSVGGIFSLGVIYSQNQNIPKDDFSSNNEISFPEEGTAFVPSIIEEDKSDNNDNHKYNHPNYLRLVGMPGTDSNHHEINIDVDHDLNSDNYNRNTRNASESSTSDSIKASRRQTQLRDPVNRLQHIAQKEKTALPTYDHKTCIEGNSTHIGHSYKVSYKSSEFFGFAPQKKVSKKIAAHKAILHFYPGQDDYNYNESDAAHIKDKCSW